MQLRLKTQTCVQINYLRTIKLLQQYIRKFAHKHKSITNNNLK